MAVDESTWARLGGTPAGSAVDLVVGPDGAVVGTPGGTVARDLDPVLDLRVGASAGDPDDRLADLVAALLLADAATDPASRPAVVLTDDPVETRRVLTVVAALRHEHDGAGA